MAEVEETHPEAVEGTALPYSPVEAAEGHCSCAVANLSPLE